MPDDSAVSTSRGRVLFLGTGTAFSTDARGNQAILFEPAGGPGILLDAGPTLGWAMEKLQVGTARVDKVFITHFHGDHTAGWPFLLLRMAFLERRLRDLDVFGPRGLEAQLGGLLELTYGDLVRSGSISFPLRYHELEVAEANDVDCGGGLVADIVPMDHHPSSIAYALRHGACRVAVSGDTRWCDGLERLAERCDVLIVECSSVARSRTAHISMEEMRERRGRLMAPRIVLVHSPDAVAADLAERPLPGVHAATDGLVLEL